MVTTLLCGCLPYKITESEISKQFEPLCEVRSVKLFADWEEATFHAYAHVEVDADDVDAVVRALDGRKVKGMPLMVHPLVQRADDRVFLERE